MSSASAFFMEFLGTTILCFVVMILTDERNGIKPSPGLYPLAMFVLFLGIGTSLGMTGVYSRLLPML
jgi:aquaglyceroporin related protein